MPWLNLAKATETKKPQATGNQRLGAEVTGRRHWPAKPVRHAKCGGTPQLQGGRPPFGHGRPVGSPTDAFWRASDAWRPRWTRGWRECVVHSWGGVSAGECCPGGLPPHSVGRAAALDDAPTECYAFLRFSGHSATGVVTALQFATMPFSPDSSTLWQPLCAFRTTPSDDMVRWPVSLDRFRCHGVASRRSEVWPYSAGGLRFAASCCHALAVDSICVPIQRPLERTEYPHPRKGRRRSYGVPRCKVTAFRNQGDSCGSHYPPASLHPARLTASPAERMPGR